MATKTPSPDAITKAEFNDVLSQYAALIETTSQSKGAKAGQKTLQELDQFRYVDAPEAFGSDKPQRTMALDDVKLLVEWKLRHGKFRPTLMSLVASNPEALTKSTIQAAMQTYGTTSNVPSALDALTKLRGIGPATASLLLTVHDPARVIFFSDEAFCWLCCGGARSPIKYTANEYQALRDRAGELMARLDVSATDVEKVAYVLLRQSGVEPKAKIAAVKKGPKAERKREASPKKRKADAGQNATPKVAMDTVANQAPGVRRSKRLRG